MRRIAILIAILSGVAIAGYGQSVAASFFVLNCRESVRLSNADEAILHTKCSDGKTYISSGGGPYEEVLAAGDAVTSIGISGPTGIAVTGSPVTGSGVISLAWQSQLPNLFFVSPNGSAGVPTFRAMVAADVPNLAESQIANLTTDLAAKAPLASPTFTGDPLAPTPATIDNDTSVATTAYVQNQSYLTTSSASATYAKLAGGNSFTGDQVFGGALTIFASGFLDTTSSINVKAANLSLKRPDGTWGVSFDASAISTGRSWAFPNASSTFVGTDVSQTLTSKTLASPVMTGDPTAPTAVTADSDTSVATTAHVHAAIAADGVEIAQDAIGAMLGSTATIVPTYVDATPALTFNVPDAGISDAKLRNSAALSVIGRATNTSGAPSDIATSADGDVLRRSGTALGFGTVATAGIANDAVTYAKMENFSATQRALCRNTAGAGDPEECTATQLMSWVGATVDGSNNFTFAGTLKTDGGTATINSAAASPFLNFQTNGTGRGLFGAAGTAGGIIGDAAIGDIAFRVNGGAFRISTNSGSSSNGIVIDASGNTTVGGNFTMAGYASAVGAWTTFTPTRTAGSGTWTGGTVSTAAYKIENKSMTVLLTVDGSTLSAAPVTISIAIPASKTATYGVRQPASVTDFGTARTGTARVAASGTTIDFTPREDFTGTWTGGANTSVSISIAFAIN